MRITHTVVETVAKHAAEFTGGAFQLQGIGGDIGHGTRYIDGIRMLVWVGRGASRQAAAYYIGGMLGWARHTGAEIPAPVARFCQAVQETYQYTAAAMQWQQQGENDAESRVRRSKEG